MRSLFAAIILFSLAACKDSTSAGIVFLIAGNSSDAPAATVIVTRDADTLYNTTYPPGAHACGTIPEGSAVDVIVQRADTSVTFPSFTLTHSAIRVQSTLTTITAVSSSEDCY